MKKLILILLFIPLVSFGQKACNVYGKIKFVDYGEDYKIKVVRYGEDFKAKEVDYAKGCN